MGHIDFAEGSGTANKTVVHKFDTGRIKPGFDDRWNQTGRFFHRVEHGQHVKPVGRQGLQLQGNLGNDA